MKKYVILIAAVLYTLAAHAQFKAGVKAGLNLADLKAVYKGKNTSVVDITNRPSLQFGALAQVGLGDHYALQAEALLTGKGARIDQNNSNTSGPRLYYVVVPVLLVYKPVSIVGLEFGAEPAFLISAREKDSNKTYDIKDDYRDKDIGLVAGLQIHITEKISLNGRYTYGLTNIRSYSFKDPDGNTSSVRYQNRAIQASVGYYLF